MPVPPSAARAFGLSLAPFLALASATGVLRGQEPAPEEELRLRPLDTFGAGRRLELTLENALRVAEANDIGLQIQEARTEAAYFNTRGSWGAFDWVLTANAGVTDSQNEQRSDLDGADVVKANIQEVSLDFTRPLEWGGSFGLRFDRSNGETNNQFAVVDPSTTDIMRVSYTQPLLRGFGRDYATSLQQESEVQYERQLQIQEQAQQELLLAVSNAYWDLVLAIQQLEVAGSSVELGEQQLERDTRVYEAGLGTEVDVIQARAQVARNSELLLQAEVNVRAAEDGLKQLLFPGTDSATWDTTLVPITPLPEEVAVDDLPTWPETWTVALDQRAELRQRELDIALADIRLRRARSERLPGLDLDLSASSQGFSGDPQEAFEEALRYDFPTYAAALVFNQPLQNRTARFGVNSARAELRAANLAYDQMQSQIVGEVREALRQLRYQSEAVRAALRSLEASERQLQAEQARNREGISTNFQVLQFQDQYVQAMNSERSARVNFMKARAAYLRAKGVLGGRGAMP
jgi:outer membrane protein TolC